MKSIFAAMIAIAFIAGAVPASAAGARGGGSHGGGTVGGGTVGSGVHIRGTRVAPPPSVPNMQSRVPAQLPEPARPPAINGPLSPNGMPSMGNGLR